MILTVDNLTKAYAGKTLFDGMAFSVNEGDKIGIVGVNGAGKSTLLRIIAGREPLDGGKLIKAKNLDIAYLAQEHDFTGARDVLTAVFTGGGTVMELLCEYEMLLGEEQTLTEEQKRRVQALSQQIDAADGWQVESEAKNILTRLGLSDYRAAVDSLSGGQKKRLALASVLVMNAELLILDEPTNHLDYQSIIWLEEYLARRRGTLLLVTHDRYFLNRVATRILELDRGHAYTYMGNYTAFLELQAAREAEAEAANRKRANLLRQELAWMRRGAQARSTKQRARIERFEELQASPVAASRSTLEIGLAGSRLGRTVVELDGISYAPPGGDIIVRDFSYTVLRNDRLAVIGPNGCGKSTLLNILSGRLQPSQGTVTIGQTVKIGYFSQFNAGMDERLRAIEYIREAAHYIDMADGTKLSASQLMESFMFTGELQWTPVGKLSGGERRRLFLLRVLMSSPNVLILDEPTNDLDIQTMAVLETFIDNFPGAVILVSHDRFFIDRLAQKVFAYEKDGVFRQYPGGFSDYQRLKPPDASTPPVRKTAAKSAPKPNRERRRKLSFSEQREYAEIETVIAAAERELKAVRSAINAAGADFTALENLLREEKIMADRLETLIERWSYLSEVAQGEAN